MSDTSYQVRHVSSLTGVTVRTLHHYDEIGLLSPAGRSAAGYRLYSDDDLLRLQQILLFRESGLALEQIRRILDDPEFDRREALLEQRAELAKRIDQSRAMLRSVDAAIATIKGERPMQVREIFDGFDPEQYQDEARERWGDSEAYKVSARRTKGYRPEDWKAIKEEDRQVMESLAAKLASGQEADGDEVMDLAERHRLHIDRWFYPCSHAMHANLAGLYTADPRFTETLDRHGEGFAEFLAEAIRANASRSE